MLDFFSYFTDSFLVAILAWPFVALGLTLPILIIQYRRYNKFLLGRAAAAYFFILYILGLVSFTLYPMPDNPVEFCRAYALSPQLTPFQFIADIQQDGLHAILQVVMNVAFFVPLGVFARLLFHIKIKWCIVVALIVSLCIETAQLTGVFWLYPCSYRLFDVDDLLFNTFGGLLGYGMAMLLPRKEVELAASHSVVRKAGLLRYAAAFAIDQIAVMATFIFMALAVYLLLGKDTTLQAREILLYGSFFSLTTILPITANGWSVGGYLVRLNHDDRLRPPLRRLLFYVARAVYLGLIFLTSRGDITAVVLLLSLLVWLKYKRLPYQFI